VGKWADVRVVAVPDAHLLMVSRYLKCIDRFYQNYVSCWMTGGSELPHPVPRSPIFPKLSTSTHTC
jgi:hypothetical protein